MNQTPSLLPLNLEHWRRTLHRNTFSIWCRTTSWCQLPPSYSKTNEGCTKFVQIWALLDRTSSSFKMMLRPQILYLFRTLPIPVKKIYILALNTILRTFVWKYMRPHSSHVLLIKHRNVGSMDMTDLCDYWVATHLSQLQSWFISFSDKLWTDIEKTASPAPSLNTLLLVNIWKKKTTSSYPSLLTSK